MKEKKRKETKKEKEAEEKGGELSPQFTFMAMPVTPLLPTIRPICSVAKIVCIWNVVFTTGTMSYR